MKKIKLKKKVIFGIGVVSVVVIALVAFLLVNKNTKNNKVLKQENYTAYVKINPLVKLNFKDSYYECKDKKGKKYTCGEHKSEVVDVALMNDDAKNIYKDIKLKNKNLEEAIFTLTKVAHDNNIDIVDFKVTMNYNYEIEKLNKTLKDKIKKELKVDTNITFNYQKSVKEQEILKSEIKSYKITFDSDGGTAIESQTIKENEKVIRPADPTKDGYNFIEWQLDGKGYDFNQPTTNDITLKATWKENKVTNNQQNNGNSNNSNTTNNDKQPEVPAKPVCKEKVFSEKYSYVYETEQLCIKNGNNDWFNVIDNVDADVFSYGCERIVDNCGKTWYGVYFNKYIEGQGNIKVHY